MMKKKKPLEYLSIPPRYLDMDPETKRKVCNGCGPQKLGGWIIPDTLWGLNITEICNMHDYEYEHMQTRREKIHADDRFYLNMKLTIYYESTYLLKPMRFLRAKTYYKAVQMMTYTEKKSD